MRHPKKFPLTELLILIASILLLSACQGEMQNRGRIKPLEDIGRPLQQIPEGAVPVGDITGESVLFTGRDENGDLATELPFELTREVLERGRERYDIYCSPCHGLDGAGGGVAVQRGFPQPPSFHTQRLREAPPGHYFDVITNGFGVMFPYNTRVAPEDRWAIAAYVRVLQASQGEQ